MSAEPARPSDHSLVASASEALRDVVLAHLTDAHARVTVVHVIGLLRYLDGRGPDSAELRRAQLSAAVRQVAGNPYVVALPGDPFDIAAAALVAVVGRDDSAAQAVRFALRPVLVGHLDHELSETAPLIAAFRGAVADG